MSWLGLTIALTARAAVRPRLAVALLTVAWRFRSRGGLLPDREYARWRMYTAYGDADAVPPVHDVERYALWATR